MSTIAGQEPTRIESHRAVGVCALLIVAVGLIYGQTLGHTLLVYDDSGFTYENRLVSSGLSGEGIREAFAHGPYGDWYPLAVLSHMLDCQLFGLNAWGHHLTNVLLHAAASIALFLVLRRMTGELWPSAVVALVFAVHPQHVESVAWVAERRDVLSGWLFMLTLGTYLGYVRRGRPLARYLLMAVLFALGLLAKPMLVTLPALLVLLDFWPLARFGMARDVPCCERGAERLGGSWLMLEKLPLGLLVAGACMMTLRTHPQGLAPPAWSVQMANAPVACVAYLVQFFYPTGMAAFYPYPSEGLPVWKVAGATAIVAMISAAAVIGRRGAPYFFVGWFWYLGMLSPVLGLVTVSDHAMADRYMYLPSIGLTIGLVWGAARLAARWSVRGWVLGTCAGLMIAVLVVCAARQTSFWRDDETLWRHALACTRDNSKAEFGLADALARQGRTEEAIVHFRLAEKHPIDAAPFSNLGVVLARLGRLDEAIEEYRQALAIDPTLLAAHVNLGVALLQRQRPGEAQEHFNTALRINRRSVEARCGLAHVLLAEEKFDEARAEFARAVAIDPRSVVAQTDLAAALLRQGNSEAAIVHCRAALAIDPRFFPAQITLGRALAANGQPDEAMMHYRQALEIDPSNAIARRNLDEMLRSGR